VSELSWTGEVHPYGSPFMARPAPEGYRKPHLTEEVGMAYVCVTCGANVSSSATELHSAWHEVNSR
jgi:hypothetical protein